MARKPIPTWYFVLVAVRRDDRFLVVREKKHQQRWYLPAGAAKPGENLVHAAERETFEETGVHVQLDGIVRIEHNPLRIDNTRLRVVYVAHCVNAHARLGGRDALQAKWVTPGELDMLLLRGEEVRHLFHYLAAGGPVYPLSLLSGESMPFLLDEST